MFLSDWRGGGWKHRKKLSEASTRNRKRLPFERRRLSLENLEQRCLLTASTLSAISGPDAHSVFDVPASNTLYVPLLSADASQTVSISAISGAAIKAAATLPTDLNVTATDNLGGSSVTSAIGTAVPGDAITYVIVVSNAGPNSATGASVLDTLPSTLSGATYTATETGGASGYTQNGSGSIDDTVDLPAGSTITYTVLATIAPTATGTLSNTATVTAPAGVTDTNLENNGATDTDALTPHADLETTVSDVSGGGSGGPTGTVAAGGVVQYRIDVTNNGPSAVTGASFVDDFPSSLTDLTYTATAFVTESGNGTGGGSLTGYAASGSGNIDDTDLDIPPGGSIFYEVQAAVSPFATGTLSNTATATAPPGAIDTNPDNNSATDTDTITPVSGLTITKTDSLGGSSIFGNAGSAVPGEAITYTVVVANATSSASGATVIDTLPSGIRSATYTASETGGATGFTPSGTGSIDDTAVEMPAGSTITYTIHATIASADTGTLSNSATVSSSQRATASLPLIAGLKSPLGIAVSGSDVFVVDDVTGRVGEYTTSGATVNAALITGLTTTNGNGPDGIAVSGGDLFITNDATGTISEYTTSGALVNASLVTGLGEPGGIAVSGSDLFVTNGIGGAIGEYTTSGATVNASLVTGLGTPEGIAVSGGDLFVANYSGSIGEYTTSGAIVNASLVTGLSETPGIAVSGGNLFVTSAGDNTIGEYTTSGATVNASLVTGMTFPSAIAVSGGELFVSSLNAGTIAAFPATGNTAVATDSDTLTPQSNLEITKTDNLGGSSINGTVGTAAAGQSITYTVVVTNTGPSDAVGALVTDALPGSLTGATFTATSTGGATGFSQSGSGSINDTDVDLPAGSSITYTVKATVSSSATGTISNSATVTAQTATPVNASLLTGLNQPIGVAVSDDDIFVLNFSAGTVGEYTTSGATVNASLVTGLNYPRGIALSGGDLFVTTAGGTISEYTTAGVLVNASLVSGLSEPAGIAVAGGDLFVANESGGTIGEYNATNGATINASLVTGLSGPNGIAVSGENLFVASYVPPNLGYRPTGGTIGEYTLSGATVNASLVTGLSGLTDVAVSGGNLFASIGAPGPPDLGPGEIGEYTLTGATVNASLIPDLGSPTAIVVSGGNLFVADLYGTIGEYTTGNDTATDTDTVTPQVELEISTTDNQNPPAVGGTNGTAVPGTAITYTIVVTNAGSGTADGATVVDPLPSSLLGATFTATATGGATGFTASGSGSIDDTDVDMPAGSTITYTVKAKIAQAATGVLSNTASVTAGPAATTNPSLVAGLNNPEGIAVSGNDVFITNGFAGTIGEYTTSGATVNAALVTGLDSPAGIAISGGDLFVANTSTDSIGEYNAETGAPINAFLIDGLNGPTGIAVSGGDIFVTNPFEGTIGEYTTSGAVVNASLVTGLGYPQGIAVSGGDLFVVGGSDDAIGEYDAATGATINPARHLCDGHGSAISHGVWRGSIYRQRLQRHDWRVHHCGGDH